MAFNYERRRRSSAFRNTPISYSEHGDEDYQDALEIAPPVASPEAQEPLSSGLFDDDAQENRLPEPNEDPAWSPDSPERSKPSSAVSTEQKQQKRSQVKHACVVYCRLKESQLNAEFVPNRCYCVIVNCQKACKKCDDERPCGRCVRLNIESKCVDKARKDRSNLKPVSTKVPRSRSTGQNARRSKSFDMNKSAFGASIQQMLMQFELDNQGLTTPPKTPLFDEGQQLSSSMKLPPIHSLGLQPKQEENAYHSRTSSSSSSMSIPMATTALNGPISFSASAPAGMNTQMSFSAPSDLSAMDAPKLEVLAKICDDILLDMDTPRQQLPLHRPTPLHPMQPTTPYATPGIQLPSIRTFAQPVDTGSSLPRLMGSATLVRRNNF